MPRFNFATKFIDLAFVLLLVCAVVLADDGKSPAPQWKLCWQLANSESTVVPPTVQNERLFLSAPGGKLSAHNVANGETLWRTELGGEIVGQTPINRNLIYAASQIAATKDKQAVIIIRALSVETGLTLWQGELSSASQFTLSVNGDYLLAATGEPNAASKIIALSADKGQLRWTQILTTELSTPLTVAGEAIIFATADKILHVLNLIDGREVNRWLLPHAAQEKIVFSKGFLLIGDKAGNVSAINETDGKTLWSLRLGGAAQNILTTGNGVLISSLDDFVYFHNLSSGKRIWRKRLSSRPLGALLLSDVAVMLAAAGENTSPVLDLKKGRLLSQVILGAENVAVAAPFAANNFVFVPTAQGLLSYAPISTACPTK